MREISDGTRTGPHPEPVEGRKLSIQRPSAPFRRPPQEVRGLDIVTFGCRLNAFESEVIRAQAAAAGLDEAVIVNTCAVTAEAERQARQAIRRARRAHPEARIIVTGCAATLAPERYAALAEVDLVLDNDAKLKAESYAPEAPTPTLPRKQGRELSEAASIARPRLLCDPPPQAGEGRVG